MKTKVVKPIDYKKEVANVRRLLVALIEENETLLQEAEENGEPAPIANIRGCQDGLEVAIDYLDRIGAGRKVK